MNISEKISLILVDKGFSLSPKKNTEDLINSGTELHKSTEDIKIVEQHGIADQIFILLKGEAEYVKYHNNVFYKLATLKNVGSPLGISGLNAPGRYMSDIFIKGNSEYISIKIENAVKKVISDGYVTKDIAVNNSKVVSTQEMGDLIIANLN